MFEFEWPWILILLPLPLLVRFWVAAERVSQQSALRVPFIDDFNSPANTIADRQTGHHGLLLLMLLCWLLLLLSAARPQWVGDPLELPISGRDLMLAVDLSGSMEVEDFRVNGQTVNRLTATKYVAGDFIEKRRGDRLGLILFGRNAYLQTPLTFDLQTVKTLLLESAIGLAGKETAIGDAIGLAIKRLKDNEHSSRVLVLLTDGANTAGEVAPLKAAELAAGHGLKIYTIGIGADEMIRESFFGRQRINPSRDLDEKTLKAIADKTGGQYFRARDTEALSEIYQTLDELEPVASESQTFRPVKSLYVWPLSMGLLLAALLTLLLRRVR